MQVTVFGMGYVGCVTAACLAKLGHTVTGVERHPEKVELINLGRSPVLEPGLEDLIREMVDSGRLRVVQNADQLGDVSVVCVGTPSNKDGSLDITQVLRVINQIGELLRESSTFHVVVIRSTVLPGTVENVILPALRNVSGRSEKDLSVCMNPEFMRETTAIQDFRHPPFTVIGVDDEITASTVMRLYAGLDAPVEQTTIREAELIKYACNAFHAAKICFANEIGRFSKRVGVDSFRVMEVFCRDTRLNISPAYLKPGFAFGGSCLPKDLRALVRKGHEVQAELPMLESLLNSNRSHLEHAFSLIAETGARRIGIFGLSFKASSDDLRESPFVDLMERLIGKGYQLRVHDEDVELGKLIGGNRQYIDETIPHIASLLCDSVDEVIDGSDLIVVGKNTPQVQNAVAKIPSSKKVLDLVRLFPQKDVRSGLEGICW